MPSWSPHDLPFQRDKATRILTEAAEYWDSPEWRAQAPDAADHAAAIRKMADMIHTAPLTWLDSDVSTLIADTMQDVPPWSPTAAMPSESGLIAFEKSPLTATWTGGMDGQWRDVTIDAIAWKIYGTTVSIRALSRLQGARDHLSPIRQHIPFDDVVGVTVDADGTLGEGANIEKRRTADYTGPTKAGKDILALTGATWLLLSQPAVVDEAPGEIAKVKRRGAPGKPKSVVPVRVSVRTLTRQQTEGHAGGGGGRGQATTRWWVRGHWRQQPWGKGRALRKPVFIAPHTAGAVDAEVDDTPHVQVWRK